MHVILHISRLNTQHNTVWKGQCYIYLLPLHYFDKIITKQLKTSSHVSERGPLMTVVMACFYIGLCQVKWKNTHSGVVSRWRHGMDISCIVIEYNAELWWCHCFRLSGRRDETHKRPCDVTIMPFMFPSSTHHGWWSPGWSTDLVSSTDTNCVCLGRYVIP